MTYLIRGLGFQKIMRNYLYKGNSARIYRLFKFYWTAIIPNTTNLLEGFNSQLKKALRNHNGMKEVNKKKFIDGFLNIKK